VREEDEMKKTYWLTGTIALAAASFALGAETRTSFVETYSAVADTILGSKHAESGIVKAILESHFNAAQRTFKNSNYAESAAAMALFANEGDNQIGGIRKRLLEGGHHHNAEGEAKGIYEAGYVIVTKAAKKAALRASADMQAAQDNAGRRAAWKAFKEAAEPLLK
jgi:hypothetical protein